ncbi:Zn(II)2Cys6 transcription factor [Aspergillus clavatus NRRL 1]|uniref:C6 finger domain protein, putative n=1 Tax=Aspergillus clavatus (strain ATCC 1007 / CBS 513.65 / DSM 816 / NCTC 3887 / NRRL 1 / QM 1276 / 107) TaxID=344612 RepID=A1CNP3_ASPCL|nr:C6 finger domain protein, putative [Aspergillus clavatus NRRL 1]EAW07264.1 C6 finger domain protein, putative [Aspergillus clavatus NRRL 1]
MVFCGKPSKGCGQCRSRKIRCDQVRPACSQCLKGNRSCPGYRDELSLMFRDESQQVVRKARNSAAGRKTKPARKASHTISPSQSSPGSTCATTGSTSSSGSSDLVEFIDESHPQPELIERQPLIRPQPSYQMTQDEAVCYFLRYTPWPGFYWMLDLNSELFKTTDFSISQMAMKASVGAVGTAMLGRVRQDTSMMIAAEADYGYALQLLAFAVANPAEVKENPTLGAVMVLAIFEVVTSRTTQNIEKWTSHIRGAAAILDLRGTEQVQNEEGLKLFIQLRFQIITSCLQLGVHVPPSVLECAPISMFLRPQSEAYGDRLIYILGRLANLRADVRSKSMMDNQEILAAAYGIESELMAWLASLPADFQYTTVENPRPETSVKRLCRGIILYNNRYHIYNDLWTCHTWNQYRCARIVVCEIILSCLRRLFLNSAGTCVPSELQNHCFRIRSTTRQLAADISASVPYHFGVGNTGNSQPGSVPVNESHTAGLVLLWPLVLAGATEGKNHPLRKWCIDCLRLIGHGMGIDQALALVDVLESEVGIFEGVNDDGVIMEEKGSAIANNKVLTSTWGSD